MWGLSVSYLMFSSAAWSHITNIEEGGWVQASVGVLVAIVTVVSFYRLVGKFIHEHSAITLATDMAQMESYLWCCPSFSGKASFKIMVSEKLIVFDWECVAVRLFPTFLLTQFPECSGTLVILERHTCCTKNLMFASCKRPSSEFTKVVWKSFQISWRNPLSRTVHFSQWNVTPLPNLAAF